MNEQQNTALVQSLYAAFSRGDVPFILGNVTGDSVWNTEGPASIAYTGERLGPEGVMGFFQALGGTLDDMTLTTDHFVAQGDMVTTFGRFAGTVKATGKSFDIPVAHLFQIRDGKVAKFIDIMESATVAEAYAASMAAAR